MNKIKLTLFFFRCVKKEVFCYARHSNMTILYNITGHVLMVYNRSVDYIPRAVTWLMNWF